MPCLWIDRSNIGKVFTVPKEIYRFVDAIPIKIPMAFFHRIRTNSPKMCMEPQNTPKYPKQSRERRIKLKVSCCSDFKLY